MNIPEGVHDGCDDGQLQGVETPQISCGKTKPKVHLVLITRAFDLALCFASGIWFSAIDVLCFLTLSGQLFDFCVQEFVTRMRKIVCKFRHEWLS